MSSQLLYKIQRKTIGTSYFSCIRILLVASLVAQLVKNHLQCRIPGFDPWVGKIPWRKERLLPTPVFWPGESYGL